nr:hypothetical protein [Streptomyces prasinopilosus]
MQSESGSPAIRVCEAVCRDVDDPGHGHHEQSAGGSRFLLRDNFHAVVQTCDHVGFAQWAANPFKAREMPTAVRHHQHLDHSCLPLGSLYGGHESSRRGIDHLLESIDQGGGAGAVERSCVEGQ